MFRVTLYLHNTQNYFGQVRWPMKLEIHKAGTYDGRCQGTNMQVVVSYYGLWIMYV